jgi:hypothetical protein
MKVIPIMQHHICTLFGISNQSYSGIDDPYAGKDQGNIILGNICRNKSYLVIKYIEKKNLGATIKSPKDKQVHRTAIAFVDNTTFSSNRKQCAFKMQYIINEYKKLYEATGGRIQEEKSFYFSWQWINSNRKLDIVNIKEKLLINQKEIEQINVDNGIRALGVYMTPKLEWIN